MLSCNWGAGGLHRPNKLASTCSPLREYLECRGERHIDRMQRFGREDARRARHWRRHRWRQHYERPVIQFLMIGAWPLLFRRFGKAATDRCANQNRRGAHRGPCPGPPEFAIVQFSRGFGGFSPHPSPQLTSRLGARREGPESALCSRWRAARHMDEDAPLRSLVAISGDGL